MLAQHTINDKVQRAIRAAECILPDLSETEAAQRFKVLEDVAKFEAYDTLWASSEPDTDFEIIMTLARNWFIRLYGYAVISRKDIEWLNLVTDGQQFVESGSGSGQLAHDCNRFGLQVIATEPYPKSEHYQWVNKQPTLPCTGQEAVLIYPDHNLLYSWPEYQEPHTAEILELFSGKFIIYIGEPAGGCTGDDEFHAILENRFRLTATRQISRFPGISDNIFIYRRKD